MGEPKRIANNTTELGNGVQHNVRFGPGTGTILRRLVNFHNIWFGFGAVPVVEDANGSGNWVFWQNLDTNSTDPIWSDAVINSGDENMKIIACGTFFLSNQAPFNFLSQLKTSRNMVANQELVLSIRPDQVTSGNIRIHSSICAGLSVK